MTVYRGKPKPRFFDETDQIFLKSENRHSTTSNSILFLLLATCTLPGGETATHDLSDAEVTALRLECFYANPVTDRAVIFSGMAKTAAARQAWIRKAHPSITDILEQYPRLEDMPLDLVCTSRVHLFLLKIFSNRITEVRNLAQVI